MKEGILRPKSINIDIAFALSTAVGITAGVILSLNLEDSALISLSGTQQKLSLAAQGGWLRVFFSSFVGVGVLLLAAFLFGFSAVSQPLELLLVAFRGVGLGICVRGVYLGGEVLRSMAVFLPYAVLSTGLLLIGAKEAFFLSMRYLHLSSTTENRLGIKTEIHDYTTKFMILAILLAALAMADAFFAGVMCRA